MWQLYLINYKGCHSHSHIQSITDESSTEGVFSSHVKSNVQTIYPMAILRMDLLDNVSHRPGSETNDNALSYGLYLYQ